MITEQMIEEKAEELLAECIADDEYLNDALCICFEEIRAMVAADNIDDKLSALDDFVGKLKYSIQSPNYLRLKAEQFLKDQQSRGD